jgi:hypothetical protein
MDCQPGFDEGGQLCPSASQGSGEDAVRDTGSTTLVNGAAAYVRSGAGQVARSLSWAVLAHCTRDNQRSEITFSTQLSAAHDAAEMSTDVATGPALDDGV